MVSVAARAVRFDPVRALRHD